MAEVKQTDGSLGPVSPYVDYQYEYLIEAGTESLLRIYGLRQEEFYEAGTVEDIDISFSLDLTEWQPSTGTGPFNIGGLGLKCFADNCVGNTLT